MTQGNFYDGLESRDPALREQDLFTRLPAHLEHARSNTTAYAAVLADIDTATITSREALATLPVTRKSELVERQRQTPPFGGLVAARRDDWQKVFASPGPIYEPQTERRDYWRLARALYAAGFRAGQLVHNTYSYHLTPAGSMLESGAFAVGCAVIPAGVGQTELQAEVIAHYRPDGYVGTPSFLKILLDKAEELGLDAGSITRASVSGEALPPSLRQELADRGVTALQTYATADLGLIAYESEALEGMIVDEDVILEIVRPGSGDPVSEGEVGEVVVTVLNPDYPLIRFATGDLSAVLPGPSPCGRTNVRIKGWMGRADQTTKVRGMFVRPEQVNAVAARHPEIGRYRLVVERHGQQDAMTLKCVVAAPGDALRDAVETSVRDLCKLRAEVVFVAAEELPNDGKVIEDARTYD
jgi:phenylacetate-CoA ligase